MGFLAKHPVLVEEEILEDFLGVQGLHHLLEIVFSSEVLQFPFFGVRPFLRWQELELLRIKLVYFPEILQGVTQGYNESFAKHEILEFKNNSNLLIIYGKAGNDFKDASKDYVQGISYFEWTGKDLRLLKFITK